MTEAIADGIRHIDDRLSAALRPPGPALLQHSAAAAAECNSPLADRLGELMARLDDCHRHLTSILQRVDI